MSTKSFVKGAAILAVAGLIVKLLGAVFRIPLTNIISADGMANYQVAYPIYALLVVISTAGIPSAISRMVSARTIVGDYSGAHKVFTTALKLLFIVGVVTTVALFFLADTIAIQANIPTSALGIKLISPSLFFVAVLSAYRGYFQGLQQMVPTASTQILEQLVKLGAGLLLASLWISKGVEYGAAGALLGVTLSEVGALALIFVIYQFKSKKLKQRVLTTAVPPLATKYKSLRNELILIAIPITLGACIMPLIMLIDTFIINNVLPTIDFSAYNPLTTQQSFGILTGAVNPLINMPAVLSLALSMSLVPAIAEAKAKKDDIAVSSRSAMGFKLAILIGLPSAIGMLLLSDNIIMLLFSSGLTPDMLKVGSGMLQFLAIAVLFLTMLQTSTGIIQGAGRPFIPLINLTIGAAVKVVLSIVLMRIPSLNINGAAIGTAACYAVAAILNIIAMKRITKPSIKAMSGVLMPIVATVFMGAAAILVKYLFIDRLGNSVTTLLAVLVAAVVYVLMLFVTRAITSDDMEYLPGGSFITRVMRKLRFWKV